MLQTIVFKEIHSLIPVTCVSLIILTYYCFTFLFRSSLRAFGIFIICKYKRLQMNIKMLEKFAGGKVFC